LSPYAVTQAVNGLIARDAIVVADCGANLCWVYQIFHRTEQLLYTSGGMSPMGYSLPAAIGAALAAPEKQIICFIGDGGLQINMQEFQTIVQHRLELKIFILNNDGYGIIKQFQDSYFGGRYEASGIGISVPNYAKIAAAYGFDYVRVEKESDITPELMARKGTVIIDVMLHPNTLIEPKLEMGRPIHDQFPYVARDTFKKVNRWLENEA
jgi:acetolactate synthase-1/2/3 large subunit